MRIPYLPGLPVAQKKRCPLCGDEDTATHILNGCKLPILKAMVIERHHEACRSVVKKHATCSKGDGHIVIADIGSQEMMRGLATFEPRRQPHH